MAFGHAVHLFDHCLSLEHQLNEAEDSLPAGSPHARALRDQAQVVGGWSFIAARDGAMSIYHFAQCLEASVMLRNYPRLRQSVDHRATRTARKLFASQFPHYRNIRHSIAHLAELTTTEENRRRNALAKPFTGIGLGIGPGAIVKNYLGGRNYANTFGGVLLAYEISSQTHAKLKRIQGLWYSAFCAL